MRILQAVSLLTVVLIHATPAAAQSTPPAPPPAAPRAMNFADTLGAAFNIADSATASGTPADFDFLVGLWEFKFQQRRPNGEFSPHFVGHWSAEKKRTVNAFVEDHFRGGDNARTTWDTGTWTYRVFNPARKLWEMQGVGSESGAWAPGLCWADAKNRYVIQRYGASVMRIRYFNITDTSFQWRADMTPDNGKTWILDWWTMEARRISR
jgi:hypothetical protein